ncbi:MAG TPA: Clp protease N-terminal domain-containing protein [Streptosporangiaceae bacterium]
MFERFSTQARQAVRGALAQARDLGASRIGCEHLLIGLADAGSGPAASALAAAGLDRARLRELASGQLAADPLDSDSLALVGIDLDEVRRAADAAFGPGAIDRPRQRPAATRARMTGECRKALELALRQARRGHSSELTTGHLLIGLIDQGDNGALRAIAAAGADPAALRAGTLRRMREAA